MLASAIAAGTLINYQFKTVVMSVFGDADERTAFIAVFFLIVLAVSTVFHVATTGGILKNLRHPLGHLVRAGASCSWAPLRSSSSPPASCSPGSWPSGAATSSSTTPSASPSGSSSTSPSAADVKYKAKIFIDMFVNKFATGLGAGLFLLLFYLRHFDYRTDGPLAQVREIGLLVLVFLVLWIVLTRLVYRRYPDVLKPEIRRRWVGGDTAIAEHVDVDLTMKVFNTIQSRERSTTIYLMNLFDLVSRSELTPDLKELLGIKRDEIRARGMDALLDVGGAGFFPGIEEAIDDPEVRREIDLDLPPAGLPGDHGQAPRRDRRLARRSWTGSRPRRSSAGWSRTRPRSRPSGRLLGDPSSEVVLYALESAAVHRRPEHVPLILALLGSPMTRAEARTALAAYGPSIVDLVAPALRDATLSPEVRRAVPEVLARVGTQRAADVLIGELACRRDGIEQALVDALSKIRAERPEVRFRKKDVRPEVLRLIRKCCDLVLEPPGRRGIGRGGLEPAPQARLRPDDAPASRRGRGPGLPEPPARHAQGGRLRPRAPRHHARPRDQGAAPPAHRGPAARGAGRPPPPGPEVEMTRPVV